MTLKGEGVDPEDAQDVALDEPPDEEPLRCAACRAPVTDRGARCERHGAHEHRRVNPSGVDFHLGCFDPAPGAVASGAATEHWTWFPGYGWRYASCRACGSHLGWRFEGEAPFWGLILARLAEG